MNNSELTKTACLKFAGSDLALCLPIRSRLTY